MIDKSSSLPYYKQLADLLRRDIGSRQAEDEIYRLPSENELAERHGLSRATVRHALDELVHEGWIYREKGVGSFAPVRRVEQDLTSLVSTTEDMQRRGWQLTTKVLGLRQLPATPYLARPLETRPGTPLFELSRLRLVGDTPLSVQTAYLPVDLCPTLAENDLSRSLYRLLETRYGLRLWSGQETLRARGTTQQEAELLCVAEGAPVLYAERVTYGADGTPVEYLEAVWRGDRYDFKVSLSRAGG